MSSDQPPPAPEDQLYVDVDGDTGVAQSVSPAPAPHDALIGSPAALRQLLTDLFDDGELRTLCFDLRIEYENLPGLSKADKARELVAYVNRHGRRADLLAICRRLRPKAAWPVAAQLARLKDVPPAQLIAALAIILLMTD
jgi:hypothetical protein